MRGVAAVAVLVSLSWSQAPPAKYIINLSPTIFQVSLPATAANPESHCYMWVRLGGFYDAEVACYVGGVFTGRLDTAPAGQGFDGGFVAPGGGEIRWLVCNPAVVPTCGAGTPAPAGLANPMYYELGARLGVGTPSQSASGYY